jgi:hypothetical protein
MKYQEATFVLRSCLFTHPPPYYHPFRHSHAHSHSRFLFRTLTLDKCTHFLRSHVQTVPRSVTSAPDHSLNPPPPFIHTLTNLRTRSPIPSHCPMLYRLTLTPTLSFSHSHIHSHSLASPDVKLLQARADAPAALL